MLDSIHYSPHHTPSPPPMIPKGGGERAGGLFNQSRLCNEVSIKGQGVENFQAGEHVEI